MASCLATRYVAAGTACRLSLNPSQRLAVRESIVPLSAPTFASLKTVRKPARLIVTRGAASSSSTGTSGPDSAEAKQQLFAVVYEYVPDIVTRREPFREEHVQLCRSLAVDGKMVAGAATGNPPTGALLILRASNREEVIRDLIEADPYVTKGLVVRHSVEPWTPAVGTMAESLRNCC